MGLEERCNDEDMHVSTANIPIIRELPLDVTDGDSPEDSRIIRISPEDQPAPQNQLPRTIYAPLGDAEFWFGIHLGLAEYALRVAGQSILDKQLVEAHALLVENDLARQFAAKERLTEELAAQKKLTTTERQVHLEQMAFIFGQYLDLERTLKIAQGKHEARIKELEKIQDLRLQLYRLCASNEIEAKETIIKMYEERFGSREELEKLARAEEDCIGKGRNCATKDYNCISKLIALHEKGKCPKTAGERMADFVEKLLSPKTYSNIVNALYTAFRGKERDADSCG
jgi:hypothetical protein